MLKNNQKMQMCWVASIIHLSYPFSAFLFKDSLSFCSLCCSSYAATSLGEVDGKQFLTQSQIIISKCPLLNLVTHAFMSLPKSSKNSTLRWEKRMRDSRGRGLFRARSKQAKISASFCWISPLNSISSKFKYSFELVWKHRNDYSYQNELLNINFLCLLSINTNNQRSPGLSQSPRAALSSPCSGSSGFSSAAWPASQHKTTPQ